MAIEQIRLEKFLELRRYHPVIDVRSPGEYNHAHIPGAVNLPLFSDEQRKIVGTIYKKENREKAIKIGLGYFGAKMADLVGVAEEITANFKSGTGKEINKAVLLHCWRGGMRSAGMAWLLDLYGIKVYTLTGGYKVFRRWVLESFEKSYPLNVIGGYTGSGKTEILQVLKINGEIMIDLEAIACHKGSAFGNLENRKQPSQEFFENKLALALLEAMDTKKKIWIEDESRRIGDLNLPLPLFRSKESNPLFFINIPFKKRLENLVNTYGQSDIEPLMHAILRIKKRLGPGETKKAVDFLLGNNIRDCFEILLEYYDKLYLKSGLLLQEKLNRISYSIDCPGTNPETIATQILNLVKQKSKDEQ
jgi:tRNA 2-selenouridine synthase